MDRDTPASVTDVPIFGQTHPHNNQKHQRQIHSPVDEGAGAPPQFHQPQMDLPKRSIQETQDLANEEQEELMLDAARTFAGTQQKSANLNARTPGNMHTEHATKIQTQNTTTHQ